MPMITKKVLWDVIKEQGLESVLELKERSIVAIGFRWVHGGDIFREPVRINDQHLPLLQSLNGLAPLHNPFAWNMLESLTAWYHENKIELPCLYGVFDTAFHAYIPPFRREYDLPDELEKKYRIKRYGFHGIAVSSIVRQLPVFLGSLPKRLLVAHLGGGASVTAVLDGVSQQNSMGFTPLDGIPMVTRSGSIDPGVVLEILKRSDLDVHSLKRILEEESGLYGMTHEKDVAVIVNRYLAGDQVAIDALHLYTEKVAEMILGYTIYTEGLDALVFSGGIGEGSHVIRSLICKKLAHMGLILDRDANEVATNKPRVISAPDSSAGIYIFEPQEDREIYVSGRQFWKK